MAGAYYNEIDPFAAHCLRALIADGVIAPGDVDERSIVDVQPDDLKGYTQCHFFAGGGLWSVAARMAGISDDEPIWTGSCPCQPFSEAGRKQGTADARHLWPDFYRLIKKRRPAIVFGEQIAAPLGLQWLDKVAFDLEQEDYAFGAADITPIAVGGSQIRQRLWFVACSNGVPAQRNSEPWGELFHWSPEPEMGCVAHGIPRRMDILRIAGNAIDPRVAATFMNASMGARL